MDLRAFYFQAAEAAATVATEEDDDVTTPKLSPNAAVRQEGRTSGGASPVAVGVHSDAMSCEGSGGARDLICPECGKAFLSDKAMYGHLRCHPGRRNKGAIRPATPVASASSVTRGDAKARKVLWMEDDLPTKWPLTAKRGRTPTVATSFSVSVQPVSVLESTYSAEEEAANTLLDLSQQARNAVAEQQMQMMPRADQLELPPDHVADPVAPEPEQPVIPDMADALQHVEQAEMRAPVEQAEMRAPVKQAEMRAPVEQAEMRAPVKQAEMRAPVKQAEMRAPVEHIFGIILQPQAPGIEPSNFIAASEPVNNSAPVVVRDEDKSISPGVKKLKKRRLHDPVSQSPDSSQPPPDPEDVRPPVRRIPSPASDRRYACPSCYKSFPTHQALGGHMASHNRAIRCAAAQQVDGLAVAQAVQNILAHRQRQDSANASSSGLGEDLRISLRPPKPVSHTCVRCRQIFSTGQALGGHMRKHFLEDRLQAAAAAAAPATAPPALAAAAVALAIAPAAVPEAQNGAPRDFDLNEMMPWE